MYKKHFENIKFLYGEKASIQMPNNIFRDLSDIGHASQISFAYSYLTTIAFLYKYAHYVDLDNKTYMNNTNIKEILGYNPKSKVIDRVIKNGGILDVMGLTVTTKNYPIMFYEDKTEEINNIYIREFTGIHDIDEDNDYHTLAKKVITNRNYSVKKPLFLFNYKDDAGTLYNHENTHKVRLREFIHFAFNEEWDNVDFLIYNFFKAKCKQVKSNHGVKRISIEDITYQLGISQQTFLTHLKKLESKKLIRVNHKDWQSPIGKEKRKMESNDYLFIGLKR